MPGEVRDRPWKTLKIGEPGGNMRKVGMIEEFSRKKKMCGSVQDGFWEVNINLLGQDFSVEDERQSRSLGCQNVTEVVGLESSGAVCPVSLGPQHLFLLENNEPGS